MDQTLLPPSATAFIIFTVIKMIAVFTVYMIGVAYTTLAERKISAWIQDRHGPNRVGPWGLLQVAADGVKNIMKEEALPGMVNKPLFLLAPAIAFIPAMIAWAVIPFGAPMPTRWGLIDMVVADMPVGFLFTLAITSIGVYGIVIAGWASNNKYALLGGLRSTAQMVSYEIAMGMSCVAVLLMAGNVSLNQIIVQQATMGWNVVLLSVAAFIFLVAAFAETNRLPFDLPEAESELITGYHTEYSAMRFSMFPISEYANMITSSALFVTLFLGGWDIPFTLWDNTDPSKLKSIATMLFFSTKVLFFVFFYIWIRWTLPRFRYDQLMSLGWKLMLPTALAYIVIVSSAILGLDMAGVARGSWGFLLAMLGLNLVLVVILFVILDRGRLISPADRRIDTARLAVLRERAPRRTNLAPGEIR